MGILPHWADVRVGGRSGRKPDRELDLQRRVRLHPDYYSGTTSLASDPLRCLGITPAAWATGGPVSLPGELPALSPEEEIQAIQVALRQLIGAGTLRSSWSRPLEMHLEHAARALADGDIRSALEMLSALRRKVQLLQDKDRLSVTAAEALVALTDAAIEDLQALEQHGR